MSEAVSTSEPVSDAIHWSGARRFFFRFSFCYLALYISPTPGIPGLLGFIPGSSSLTQAIIHGWMYILPWFATHVFHLSGTAVRVYRQSGTGDKTLDFVLVGVFFLIAAVLSLVWSVMDAKRTNYVTLDAWLRLAVRYFLIYEMLDFGLAKVIPIQFTQPRLTDLLTPFGMRTSAGAFWTVMGMSPSYVIFSGLGELTAATLLMIPRTTAIGAIVTSAVMSNVVALNFGFNLG